MIYYIQTDKDNFVSDIVTYDCEEYQKIEYNYTLPNNIMAGYWKWENGNFVEYTEQKLIILHDNNTKYKYNNNSRKFSCAKSIYEALKKHVAKRILK